MTNPMFGMDNALSIDDLMDKVRGKSALDNISELMGGMDPSRQVTVPPVVAKFFYGLSQSVQGIEVLDYLADITVRRIEPMPAGSFEQVALFAAAKQRDQQLMLTICRAIVEGKKISDMEPRQG